MASILKSRYCSVTRTTFAPIIRKQVCNMKKAHKDWRNSHGQQQIGEVIDSGRAYMAKRDDCGEGNGNARSCRHAYDDCHRRDD